VVPLAAATSGPHRDELREQPIGELLKQLANETTTLVRQELELAKAEVRQKGRQAGPGFGLIGGAGAVALGAFGALTAFFVLALDGVMPNWLAALVVAVVYGAIAAFLYVRGKEKVEDAGSPVPEQTVETLKEDVEWAKHPKTSATR
jgi:Putative Actinobacterial Holin-X, holin superfamily III